jgi:hypothetical protein
VHCALAVPHPPSSSSSPSLLISLWYQGNQTFRVSSVTESVHEGKNSKNMFMWGLGKKRTEYVHEGKKRTESVHERKKIKESVQEGKKPKEFVPEWKNSQNLFMREKRSKICS